MVVDDGSEAGRDDDPFYAWGVLGDRAQDSSCTIDGGLIEILHHVLAALRSLNQFHIKQTKQIQHSHIENKRRAGMHHSVELTILQNLVESPRSRHVGDNSKLELVCLESIAQVSGFRLRTDGADDVIAALEEDSNESNSDEAIGTGNKDGRHYK